MTALEVKTGPVLMKIPILGPDLRVKHSPTILGLVSFPLHLSGEGPKERWVGVEVPGLRSCVFQTSNSFLHSFHLLIFKDSATRLPPLGSPGRTEPAPPGGLGSLHSDGILSLPLIGAAVCVPSAFTVGCHIIGAQ